jgi:hypothetical protein
MIKIIKFFKQDNKWYADVPNHSLEDNEMVMGADIFLDAISAAGDTVFIKVTDEEPRQYLVHFHMKSHDDEGAYYNITGPLYNEYAPMLAELYAGFEPEIWICNVTHAVLGEHPEDIYIIDYQI